MSADVRDMEAGRELDALVAERVMGWRWMRVPGGRRAITVLVSAAMAEAEGFSEPEGNEVRAADGLRFVPRLSTDFAAAWQVVEHMRPRFWTKIGAGLRIATGERLHEVEMGRYATAYSPAKPVACDRDAEVPLAICRAALAAVEAP